MRMVPLIQETFSLAQTVSTPRQEAKCGVSRMKSTLSLSKMTRLVRSKSIVPGASLTHSSALESQYQCLYGIASSSCGLPAGEIDIGFNDKRSTIVIAGKNDRTYYFVFEKMNKIYKPPHIPRYTQADRDEFAKRHSDMKITERVSVGDIHKNSVSSTLVGIETATYKVSPSLISLPVLLLTVPRSGLGVA